MFTQDLGNFLFTMHSGTTRAQQRMMAKLFSARSGIGEFPVQPDGPLGRAPNQRGLPDSMKIAAFLDAYLAVLGLLSAISVLLLAQWVL